MNKPNILVVVFDTLRWDYFQKFMSSDTSFAGQLNDFVFYDKAFSPSSWTLPSHFSLFTGLYPSEHGVHENENSEIEEVFKKAIQYQGKFLTEVASSNGYRTFGISANPWISPLAGFDLKFHEFHSIDPLNFTKETKVNLTQNELRDLFQKSDFEKLLYIIRKQGLKNIISYEAEKMKSYLNGFPKNKGYSDIFSILEKIYFKEPFFCFLNFMEMHDPYFTRYNLHGNHDINPIDNLFNFNSFDRKKISNLRTSYYNQILKIKIIILNLLEFLRKRNIYDKTLIVFTSDHGQSLGENNYYGHGIYLYDELIHIPLFIKPPYKSALDNKANLYINLVDLYDFLSDAMKGEAGISEHFQKDKTFSETFGIQYSKSGLQKYINSTDGENVYKRINAPRKVVLKDGCKLSLNGNFSEVEEFFCGDVDCMNERKLEKINELLFELQIFNVSNTFLIKDSIGEV